MKNVSVTTRFLDFWLIGGASIVVLASMIMMNFFRESLYTVHYKFLMFGTFFALSSILCNHPHFIIGYKFGYTRGIKFLLRYWFSLIVVPLCLMALYVTAFYLFDRRSSDFYFVNLLNYGLGYLHLNYQFGANQTLGPALLSLSIWLMYLTVGWHYAMQVYGCMMVYDTYDKYGLSKKQKLWIRYSLLSLGAYQFLHLSRVMYEAQGPRQDYRFPGITLDTIDVYDWIHQTSLVVMIMGALGTLYIFFKRYQVADKIPSAPFIISWIALYAWWIQIASVPEFYFLAVPFFHSLQYLPFAGKMELATIPDNFYHYINISLRLIVILVAGVMLFEFIPGYLDQNYLTDRNVTFFTTSFAVFLNIHHFFIDATVWKLDQKEMREAIL